jgi:3-hydroxybutyryl-CoA dehydratase
MYKRRDKFEFTKIITSEMVLQYANVSGDYNPIHLNREAAIKAGFQGEIVHGMLTMGMSATLLFPFLKDGYYVSEHETKFIAPMLVGAELRIVGTIEHIEASIVHLSLFGEMNGQEVISGSAELRKDRL